jgi:hypothetical protein
LLAVLVFGGQVSQNVGALELLQDEDGDGTRTALVGREQSRNPLVTERPESRELPLDFFGSVGAELEDFGDDDGIGALVDRLQDRREPTSANELLPKSGPRRPPPYLDISEMKS